MKNSFKLFILAHKNNRGIHKRIVYTVIMILLFLLLIIPFSIFKTYDNELKRFEKENDSSKIVSFFYSEKEKYEKIKMRKVNILSKKKIILFHLNLDHLKK